MKLKWSGQEGLASLAQSLYAGLTYTSDVICEGEYCSLVTLRSLASGFPVAIFGCTQAITVEHDVLHWELMCTCRA